MRKKILLSAAALVCVLLLLCAACAEESKPSLTIDTGMSIVRDLKGEGEKASGAEDFSQEILIYKGKSAKLTGNLENVQPPKKNKLTWESSDPAVATVKNGTVTGKTEGTALITCTALLEDGTELKASVPVAVEVAVTSLSAKTKAYSVYAGYSLEPIDLAFKPDNATCRTVSWSSADESVATVDKDGVIAGVKEGKTTITAVSDELTDGKQKPKAVTVTVNVLQPAMEKAAVTWDLEGDKSFLTSTCFAGYGRPLLIIMKINDLAVRELEDGRIEMTFTFESSFKNFNPTDAQIKNIAKSARNGKIGGSFAWCIVDYSTGLELAKDNIHGVEYTSGEWIHGDKKEFKASDGSWIRISEKATTTATVTWPSEYKDLCLGVCGCSEAFLSKKEDAFWEGKAPFHETVYYFKDHPEYTHFMRVNDSTLVPGSNSDQ